MKTTLTKRVLSAILCIVLVAAVALFTTSCNDNEKETPATTVASSNVTVLGEGKTKFTFTVTDYDSNVKTFEIHTDKTIVGDALLELGLISGDEGPYGLYVKEVNGITADYEKDNAYWAFYIGGNLAQSGVDTIEIVENETYAFMVTKS